MNKEPFIFVLSLARATARRERCIQQLEKENIPYRILDAVDGKLQQNLPQRGRLKNTEVGCYMSHLIAYEKIVAENSPYGIILEDDFKLLRHGELKNVVDEAPQNWDHIQLHKFRYGDGSGLKIVGEGKKFNRLQPCGVCTHGYAVSQKFARYMLDYHRVPTLPIDLILCEISKRPECLFFELREALVGLIGGPSFIQ